jgi:hypothetical protein
MELLFFVIPITILLGIPILLLFPVSLRFDSKNPRKGEPGRSKPYARSCSGIVTCF